MEKQKKRKRERERVRERWNEREGVKAGWVGRAIICEIIHMMYASDESI